MSVLQPKRIWHYTVRQNIESLLTDGFIDLATAGVAEPSQHCAWFSSNPLWETTTAKGFVYGDEIYTGYAGEMDFYHQCFGLVRIEVLPSAAPHDWHAFKRLSGITARDAKLLYDSAIRTFRAKPSQWWASFEPVANNQWISIEEWNGTDWVPYGSDSHSDDSKSEHCEARLNDLIKRYIDMNVFRTLGRVS